MTRTLKILTFLSIVSILMITSCYKDEKAVNISILKKLYKTYENGSISVCYYKGDIYYGAGLNYYDAGGVVYNKDGDIIGDCNYAWGQVDDICEQLQDCEVVYRGENAITGQPPVDKYGLGK